MIVVMKHGSTGEDVQRVVETIQGMNMRPHVSQGDETTIIGLIGDERGINPDAISLLRGVEKIIPVVSPYKLASRAFHPKETIVPVSDSSFGPGQFVVIAGPCAVESREQMLETAHRVKQAGAHMLRGGAFKPRTSPYSFQGLRHKGLEILAEVKQGTGLPVITEVINSEDIRAVSEVADVLQIGARNMQNFALLEAVSKSGKPVMLKRGMMSTVEELLLSAEYILVNGNSNVILCERGIRTFEKYTRNTLDISAVPAIKEHSHLPVVIDPSHASGRREYVIPLARAAAAVGADGVMIEVHPHPEKALCDGRESVTPDEFCRLISEITAIASASGRKLH